MQSGNTPFKPGEWKVVNTAMDDLRKGLVPLPVREPSKVLFELLGLIVQSGKELASVAEIMVGKMPGQNTPATTTQTAVEEGMRLFTAIYKRIYRAFTQELKQLYKINSMYLPEDAEMRVLRDPELEQLGRDDYELTNISIRPSADPQVASQAQKIAKTQALLQLVPSGKVNVDEVIKRALEAQEQPNIEKLLQVPPPQPSPEQQKMQAEMQMKQQEQQMKQQIESQKAMMKQQEMQMKMQIESAMAANKIAAEKQMAELKLMVEQVKAMMEMKTREMEHGQQMRMMMQQSHAERLSNEIKLDSERKKNEAQVKSIEAKSKANEEAQKRKMKIKRTTDGYDIEEQ